MVMKMRVPKTRLAVWFSGVWILAIGCDRKAVAPPDESQPDRAMVSIAAVDPNGLFKVDRIPEDVLTELLRSEQNKRKSPMRHHLDNMPMYRMDPNLIGPREIQINTEGYL